MSWGTPDPMFDGWQGLDWKERRERRFGRWLSARNVQFSGDAARQDYTDRVQLLIDAIALKKPARVPVTANVQFFLAQHSGLTKQEAMYDHQKSAAALIKYHEDFRPDFQAKAVSPARVFELLGLEFIDWPGKGLPEETPWQYLEAEYMREDEYDALLTDPEGFFRRALLPRFGSAFAPLAALPPFTDFMEAAAMPYNMLGFGSPGVVEGMQRLVEVAGECFAWLKATGAAGADAAGRLGIPPEWSCSGKAPYDVLADTLRGTKGIMIDRFRRPDKILAAAERFVPLMIDFCVRQAAHAESPVVIFWLHKGADSFMSEADYRTFYWPTLKAVIMGLIEQGLVPALFAQGSYAKRLRHHRRRRDPGRQCHLDARPDRHGRRQAGSGGSRLHRGQRAHGVAGAGERGRGGAVRDRLAERVRHRWRLHPAKRSRAGRRQGGQPQSDAGDGAELARVGAERPA